MEEKELVKQLKQGDKAAFGAIYDQYWRKVHGFVLLYLTSSVEAEDVVQDVFVKLWKIRDFIDEEKNFKGFLFIITRNLLFNRSRQGFSDPFLKMTALSGVESSYEIEDELMASDLKVYIDKLIGDLPPRQQEVFRLSRNQQLSYREIADQLDISERTVERHIYEVLKYLKVNLKLYLTFLSLFILPTDSLVN